LNNSDNNKELKSLIKNKYFNNVRFYIIDNVLSNSLKEDLKRKSNSHFSQLIVKSKKNNSVLEGPFIIRNYCILSKSILSVFGFVLFLVFAFIFRISDLFKTVELKSFAGFFWEPFQLFVFSSINFFLSIWTFINYQKFIKRLFIITQDLEIMLTRSFEKKEKK
jgi:hypothetical protein